MFLRGLQPLLFILFFTLVYQLVLSQEGIASGVFVVWRILLLVSLASVLTLTTKPLDMAKGLEQLFKPLSAWRIPVEAFALMIMIAIRFIPTITRELDRIILAQKARGYDIRAAKGHQRLWQYMLLVVPLLITTIGRAEQLAMTIDARAYGNGKGRTSFRVLKFSRMDYAAGGLMLAFVLLILYL
jgi:energy-coupling factor transport system permease protein